MTTFAEHSAALEAAQGTTAASTKEIRTAVADHLASRYDVPVYRSPTTAMELPCGMIFAGGGRDYREQTGFEAQTIHWAIVFLASGDDDDIADWFDDILDTIATELMGIAVGPNVSPLRIDRIREPLEATTGSTEVLALRIEVSTVRSSC